MLFADECSSLRKGKFYDPDIPPSFTERQETGPAFYDNLQPGNLPN